MKKAIITTFVLAIAIAAIIIGWGSINNANAPGDGATTPDQNAGSSAKDVTSLVSFTLPAGWQQNTCPDDRHVYIEPNGTALDCTADPKAPISLLVDPRETKDCQHVTAPNGVLGHTCKSLFVDGHKTILSSTEYPKSELYPEAETITEYYIDTGKGVVQISYSYGAKGTNTYQMGFEELAKSIKIR